MILLEQLNGAHPHAPAEPVNNWSSRLVSVESSWISDEPPPREYLLRDTRTGRGAVPATGVALGVAAGGAGKSYAGVALLLAVATGKPWLGVLAPERPGRACIVTAEDPADEVRRRIFNIAQAQGITKIPEGAIDVVDVHDVHMPLLTKDSAPTEYAAELVDLMRKRGPYAVTLVDPLARLSGASIDGDNVSACSLVTVLESIASAGGGLVLGLHHTSQTARRNGIVDATAIRGATGLGDSARLVLVLSVETVEHDDPQIAERLGEIVTVTRAKANHIRRWDPIRLRRGDQGVLLPLDAYDEKTLADARADADPVARRQAMREELTRTRTAEIATAVVAVLGEHAEGLSYRALRAAVRLRVPGGCGEPALDAALVSLGDRVQRVPGMRGSTIHVLVGEP